MIIYIVMKSLRKLFCCCLLCFLFFGVLPGSALAVEYPIYFNTLVFNPKSGDSFSPVFSSATQDPISSLVRQYDFSQFYYSGSSHALSVLSEPFSVSGYARAQTYIFPANFNATEFTVYLDLNCYITPDYYGGDVLYYDEFLSFPITPTNINLIVYFSDGSSQTISFNSSSVHFLLNSPFSFTFKRASDGQYIMTSDDFNLSNSAGSVSSNGIDGVPNAHIAMQQASISSQLASFRPIGSGTNLGTFTASMADVGSSMADIAISSGSFDLSHSTVSDSVVTLKAVSDSVYIRSFDFNFNFNSGTVTYPNFDITKPLPYYIGKPRSSNAVPIEFYTFFKCIYSVDISAGDGSAGYLASIYSFLRFDLPNQLKHLIIPTTEEVTDVITDAADNIKQNAGGLGQALQLADQEVSQLQQAITSSEATPFIFPALEFDCFGNHVKLWEDTDFTPFLENDAVRLVMTPAELMMIYVFAKLLLRQFYLMFVCLSSGMSYSGFLRYLTSRVD